MFSRWASVALKNNSSINNYVSMSLISVHIKIAIRLGDISDGSKLGHLGRLWDLVQCVFLHFIKPNISLSHCSIAYKNPYLRSMLTYPGNVTKALSMFVFSMIFSHNKKNYVINNDLYSPLLYVKLNFSRIYAISSSYTNVTLPAIAYCY